MEDAALFLHLLGAFSFVSGALVAGVAFEAARRRSSPPEIALLLGLTRVGVALVGAGIVLVLGFGLWLVHLGGWSYSAGWIVAAVVLLAASAVLGAIGGQRPKQARLLAERLSHENGQVTDELRRLLDDTVSRAANLASAALVLVIVALMVWKPS